MANTISTFYPSIYDALDIVARELVGFTNAVTRNSSAERVGLNQTVTWPVAPASAASDITPGLYAPDAGDQVIGSNTLTISKSRAVPVRWNGEEQRGVQAGSGMLGNIMRDQFAQAMRTLVNEVETDLAALFIYASRAAGSGGTTPFGTANNLSDFAGVQQILDENGTPTGDRHIVLGSAAMANLRGLQSVLFKVNEAGTDEFLRNGVVGRVEGLDLHYSGQVKNTVKGTGASYIWNGVTATAAVGVTDCPVDTGSGTILAGDNVTFTGDTNKYLVSTGITAAGTFKINKPGRRVAGADNAALTVNTGGAQNLAFHRSAIHLVTRAPAMPEGGDMADDVTEVTDPISGLAFQIALYRQYRQIKFEVGMAWGVSAVKSEFMAVLLG